MNFYLLQIFVLLTCCFGWSFETNFGEKDYLAMKYRKDFKIVCYFTNWSQYRKDLGKFLPENVRPELCTHIIYAFAKINDNHKLESYEWNDESTPTNQGNYEKITNLKKRNPYLKVLLAVGGIYSYFQRKKI
jgi:GH18 family chitinase